MNIIDGLQVFACWLFKRRYRYLVVFEYRASGRAWKQMERFYSTTQVSTAGDWRELKKVLFQPGEVRGWLLDHPQYGPSMRNGHIQVIARNYLGWY